MDFSRDEGTVYRDRIDAGRCLARALTVYAGRPDVVVLGLPRGGVPVAAEVARVLGVPWDVLVSRKIPVPDQPELALGAVAEGGAEVLNDDVFSSSGVTPSSLKTLMEHTRAEVRQREALFRAGRAPLALEGKTALVVDDGVATGATLRAACRAARRRGAARVVAAVPVGPPEGRRSLGRDADFFVCPRRRSFSAVGEAYRDFSQVSDREVLQALGKSLSAH